MEDMKVNTDVLNETKKMILEAEEKLKSIISLTQATFRSVSSRLESEQQDRFRENSLKLCDAINHSIDSYENVGRFLDQLKECVEKYDSNRYGG